MTIRRSLTVPLISCWVLFQSSVLHSQLLTNTFPSPASEYFGKEQAVYINISSDNELDRLLGHLLLTFPQSFLSYIRHPADLQSEGLFEKVIVKPSGEIELENGRLFDSEPVILIVDYRKMSPAQVAELNQLLDSTPSFQGKALDTSTFIIAVADESKLTDPNAVNLPVSDFWRRIDGLGHPFDLGWFEQQQSDCTTPLSQFIQSRILSSSDQFRFLPLEKRVIDFARGRSFYDNLTGGLEIDESGGITAPDSILHSTDPALIVLKDAPWRDTAFQLRLANILVRNSFDSNGICYKLRDNLFFAAANTSSKELEQTLRNQFYTPASPDGEYYPLNSNNFDITLNGLFLDSEHLKKANVIDLLSQNFVGFQITSKLSLQQWLRLTTLLKQTQNASSQTFGLKVLATNQPLTMPEALIQVSEPTDFSSIEILPTSEDSLTTEKLQRQYPDAYIEQITSETDAREVLELIRLTSFKSKTFERTDSKLYQALNAGQPVILKGLSSNPEVQSLTESFLLKTPVIQRFGEYQSLPQLNLKVVWDMEKNSSSPLWQQLINQTVFESSDIEENDRLPTIVQLDTETLSSSSEQLAAAINEQRLLLLEGPAGSGKSYLAEKVSRQLNAKTPPFVLTTGPTTRREDLFGEQSLKGKPIEIPLNWLKQNGFSETFYYSLKGISGVIDDEHILIQPDENLDLLMKMRLSDNEQKKFEELYIDYETKLIDGPVVEWAKTTSENGEPIILILDEGNLLPTGLQALFEGIFAAPPFINDRGNKWLLSDQHRLVLTGNPSSFQGRQLIPLLEQQAYKITFPAMNDDTLQSQLIIPYLNQHYPLECMTSLCEQLAIQLLALKEEYLSKTTDLIFSARDIMDVLSRFAFYTGDQLSDSLSNNSTLLEQAFYDSLSGMIQDKAQQTYLKSTLDTSNPGIIEVTNAFEVFFTQLASSITKLHMENESTKDLSRRIWLELQRVNEELQTKTRHPGRHALLIEGPAGRGKDVVLAAVEQLWRQQLSSQLDLPVPMHINAGLNNWDTLKSMILRAKKEGRVLIVSELNLIPTHYLEGILNDILAGAASPGFFLFATINPAEYSGRNPLSKALASRFTQLILDDYTLEDLQAIASHFSTRPEAQTIAQWHYQRVTSLKAGNAKAIPAVMKMISFLRQFDQQQSDPLLLKDQFQAAYRLYLKDGWVPENPETNTGNIAKPVTATASHSRSEAVEQIKRQEISNTTSNNTSESDNSVEEEGYQIIKNIGQSLVFIPAVAYIGLSYLKEVVQPVAVFADEITFGLLSNARQYLPDQLKPYNTGNSPPLVDRRVAYDPDHKLDNAKTVFAGNISVDSYRIKIYRMQISASGGITFIPEPRASGLTLNDIPENTQEMWTSGRHLGFQNIASDRSQSLVSLFEQEKLVALKVKDIPSSAVDIEYDPYQGMHYINVKTNGWFSRNVDVEYVIEQTTDNNVDITRSQPPEQPFAMAPEARKKISEFFQLHPDLQNKIDITDTSSVQEKIEKIALFTRTFTETNDRIDVSFLDSPMEVLLETLRRQVGACRHRTNVAALLAAYYNIPARLVKNVAHIWPEFSNDKGATWKAYDLGGYATHESQSPLPEGLETIAPKQEGDSDQLLFDSKLQKYIYNYEDSAVDKVLTVDKSQKIIQIPSDIAKGYAGPLPRLDPEDFDKIFQITLRYADNDYDQKSIANVLGLLLQHNKTSAEHLGNFNFYLATVDEYEPYVRQWIQERFENITLVPVKYEPEKPDTPKRAIDALPDLPIRELLSSSAAAAELKEKWSFQPKGHLNINRLIQRQAPFGQTTAPSKDNDQRIIFHFPEADFIYYNDNSLFVEITTKIIQEKNINTDISYKENHKTLVNIFIQKLYYNSGLGEGLAALYVDPVSNFLNSKPSEAQLLIPKKKGNYLQWFNKQLNHRRTSIIRSSDIHKKLFPNLKAEELPSPWNKAIIINDDNIKYLYEAFLRSLSKDQVTDIINEKGFTFIDFSKPEI